MFWFRVDQGHELAMMAKIRGPPDMRSCSESTKSAGENLGTRYMDAATFGIEFLNIKPWVEFTTAWVKENPIQLPPFIHEFNRKDNTICR